MPSNSTLPPMPGLPEPKFKYEQAKGNFYVDGKLLQIGYSGAPDFINQTEFEGRKNQGPIPRGLYSFGQRYGNHPKLGPMSIALIPDAKNNMFGRSDFMIHRDSLSKPGTASQGGIILGRVARNMVWNNTREKLLVY